MFLFSAKSIWDLSMGMHELLQEYFESAHLAAHKMALKYAGNPQDAAEALQAAAMRALETKHPYNGKSSFSSWFIRVVINECFKKRRYDRLHAPSGQPIDLLVAIHGQSTVLLSERLIDPDPDPFQNLAQRERNDLLLREVAALPEDQRSAIFLRYFLDLSSQEIARLENTTLAAVKSRLHRSRLRLQSRLEALGITA